MPRDDRFDLRALLDAAEAAPPTAGVDALATELAHTLGAGEVSFLIADISGGALARIARARPTKSQTREREPGESVPIDGTAAGLALRSQQVQVAEDDGEVWVYAPVTERGEAIGVLELVLTAEPNADTYSYLASAAHAFAYLVIADRRYTDLYEGRQRSSRLTLEAEIQRQLLPASYTCEAGQFTIAGWLVPANEAGGDTFDYSQDRETLHLSISDAMGHGVGAALLATLAVSGIRNERREGSGLVRQAKNASSALVAHARRDQFVSGLLLQVELSTGAVQVVNAGHIRPLLVRDGQVREVALAADSPFGVVPNLEYRLQHFQLEPGDRLVLLTDGMFDRNAAAAHVADLLADLVELHPREAVQALTGAVVRVTEGNLLDDATALVLDWYGGTDHTRDATAGASQDLASPPPD